MALSRFVIATLAATAAIGLAGCGSSHTAASVTSTTLTAPTTRATGSASTAPTATTIAGATALAQAKSDLDGSTGMLNGANSAIGAADPDAAKAQEGTAP